jgi:ribosomal protein S18 acetylase RimI-like enzyme
MIIQGLSPTVGGWCLRQLNRDDLAGIVRHLLDLDLVSRNRRFNGSLCDATIVADVRRFDVNSDILFGAVEAGNGRIVGLAEARSADYPRTVEIGSSVLATHRGRGLARELIRRAIDEAFSRGAIAARLSFDQTNPTIARIAIGLGAEFNAPGRAVVRARPTMTTFQ